jgi:hypothetical protein
MRRVETLREYTNHYFGNHNTLAGVKDEDVIAYEDQERPGGRWMTAPQL